MALLVVGTGLALVVVLFLVVYFVIFPTSSPKPFKLATSTATAPDRRQLRPPARAQALADAGV